MKEIIDNIIRIGYPELSHCSIKLDYGQLSEGYMVISRDACPFGMRNTKNDYIITIDKSIKNLDERLLIGGLAHEISHIHTSKDLSPVEFVQDFVYTVFLDESVYQHSKKYRQKEERKTDLLAFKRGFGPNLLEFAEYLRDNGVNGPKKYGLSIEEMKSLL